MPPAPVIALSVAQEAPDVIVVEGQGALRHPAYPTSAFILRGTRPDAVVLQHAPGRNPLGDFVGRLAPHGIAVTDVTQAALGWPALARTLPGGWTGRATRHFMWGALPARQRAGASVPARSRGTSV